MGPKKLQPAAWFPGCLQEEALPENCPAHGESIAPQACSRDLTRRHQLSRSACFYNLPHSATSHLLAAAPASVPHTDRVYLWQNEAQLSPQGRLSLFPTSHSGLGWKCH